MVLTMRRQADLDRCMDSLPFDCTSPRVSHVFMVAVHARCRAVYSDVCGGVAIELTTSPPSNVYTSAYTNYTAAVTDVTVIGNSAAQQSGLCFLGMMTSCIDCHVRLQRVAATNNTATDGGLSGVDIELAAAVVRSSSVHLTSVSSLNNVGAGVAVLLNATGNTPCSACDVVVNDTVATGVPGTLAAVGVFVRVLGMVGGVSTSSVVLNNVTATGIGVGGSTDCGVEVTVLGATVAGTRVVMTNVTVRDNKASMTAGVSASIMAVASASTPAIVSNSGIVVSGLIVEDNVGVASGPDSIAAVGSIAIRNQGVGGVFNATLVVDGVTVRGNRAGVSLWALWPIVCVMRQCHCG